MASELKPCPFCGGTDVNLHHSAKAFMSWVSCKSCGLDAPSETGVTDEEAITYWNTSPAPADLKARDKKRYKLIRKSLQNKGLLPAATDTGLETVGHLYYRTDSSMKRYLTDILKYNPDEPAFWVNEKAQKEHMVHQLVTRSQAEELLAVKDADMDQVLADNRRCLIRIAELEADNAAQAARIKELEADVKREAQSSTHNAQDCLDEQLRAEALEAKLAAANDLVVRAQVIIPDHYVNWHRDARAVLGGKPS